MTFPVEDNDGFVQVVASDAQTLLTCDFPILAETDFSLIRTRAGADAVLALGDDYTVAGVQVAAGFTVTLDAGAVGGDVYSFIRMTEAERVSGRFATSGAYNGDAVNAELDRLMLLAQEARRDGARSLRLAAADPLIDTHLPPIAGKGGKTLSVKQDATGFTLSDPDAERAEAAAEAAVGAAALITAAVGMYSTPVSGLTPAPTGFETSGKRYIVGPSPSGAFAGKANHIAQLNGSTWVFAPPLDGLQLNVTGTGFGYRYLNDEWEYKFNFGGDTKLLNDSLNPRFDIVLFEGSDAFVITSVGDNAGGAFHVHKTRGTLDNPTPPLNNDYLFSMGLRALDASGYFGGSSAAILCNLTEDSGLVYSGCKWSFEGTTSGGVRLPWMTMVTGFVGIGNSSPNSMLDVQRDQNANTRGVVRNYSNGASAQAQLVVDNGINVMQMGLFGDSYSGSGITAAGRGFITTDGKAGLAIFTGANQPIRLGVNNTEMWNITTAGALVAALNNTYDIGATGNGIKNIYSNNSLNIVSDAFTKRDIRALTPAEIAAGNAVRWKMFRHRDWEGELAGKDAGDLKHGDRWHAGVEAQQVEEAFAAQGLDAYAYGVLGKSPLFQEVQEEIEEEIEVERMRRATHSEPVIEIVNGKAIQTFRTVEVEEPEMQHFPLFDADGAPLYEPGGKGDVKIQLVHSVPVMDRVMRKRIVLKKVPVMDGGVQRDLRFVRYTELKVFCLAAHEARLDALEAGA